MGTMSLRVTDAGSNYIGAEWIWTEAEPPRSRCHPFRPVGRVDVPEDVAAGPDSGFITEAEFVVDGGYDAKDDFPGIMPRLIPPDTIRAGRPPPAGGNLQ
jgi:hypothetical protein